MEIPHMMFPISLHFDIIDISAIANLLFQYSVGLYVFISVIIVLFFGISGRFSNLIATINLFFAHVTVLFIGVDVILSLDFSSFSLITLDLMLVLEFVFHFILSILFYYYAGNPGGKNKMDKKEIHITEVKIPKFGARRLFIVNSAFNAHFMLFYYSLNFTDSVIIGLFIGFGIILLMEPDASKLFKNFLSHIGSRVSKFGYSSRYRASIKVIQLPPVQNNRESKTHTGKIQRFPADRISSWVKTYGKGEFGVQLTIENGLNWEFYTIERKKKRAIKTANGMLKNLKTNFPGFNGTIEVSRISERDLRKQSHPPIFEIKLPRPPYQIKLPIMNFIASTARNTPEDQKICIIMAFSEQALYKKYKIISKINQYADTVDPAIIGEIESLWEGNPYKIKILIKSGKAAESREEYSYIKKYLEEFARDLLMDLKNPSGKSGKYRTIEPSIYRKTICLELRKGTIITPHAADFDFSADFPIKRAKLLHNEVFSPVKGRKAGDDFLDIGFHVKMDVKQNSRGLISYDSLSQNMLIAGVTGVGKTLLLKNILKQVKKFRPSVGNLIINTAKGREHRHYSGYKIIGYNQSDFNLPYIVLGANPQKSIQKTGSNLAASLGLPDFTHRIFSTPIEKYYNNHGSLPETIDKIFAAALVYLKNNKYGEEIQNNTKQAIAMRGRELVNKYGFLEKTRYTQELPEWFLFWLNGGDIFLDLFECDEVVKQLLVLSLLQMIDTFTENINWHSNVKLMNLVVFDEAHVVLGKPEVFNQYSDAFIRQSAVNRIISSFLTEFRSRGLGVIIADQRPSSLINTAADQPAIKIIFRIGSNCSKIYATDLQLQQFITEQSNFSALVFNGTTGEKYCIHTYPPESNNNSNNNDNSNNINDNTNNFKNSRVENFIE